jgi:hypothetical protein
MMELKIITLSEISHMQKNKYHMYTLACVIKGEIQRYESKNQKRNQRGMTRSNRN